MSVHDVVPAGSDATVVKDPQPSPVHRCTVKDVSVAEVSVHPRSTVLDDVAVAVSPVGADGGAGGCPVPTAPKTSTWKDPDPEKLSIRSVHVPAAAPGMPIVSKRPGAAQLPLLAWSLLCQPWSVGWCGSTR